MSGYSRREVADSYVAEPAVHNLKKTSESNKGEQHDENKCDREIQHDTKIQNCALSDIKISNVCSLSKIDFHYNSSVTSKFKESQLDSADPNDWKLLSESDEKRKLLDSHSASESLNKSDCNVGEVGAWIPENVSTNVDVHKGKNLNESIFSDLTEEGPVSTEPKLSVTPTVSSPVSKFSRINTRSIAYSQPTGIETLTGNPDAKKRPNSSVGQSIVPSDNKPKPDTEGNIENKSFDKKFCCVLSWTASIYGQQHQCPCVLPKGATTASQDYVPQSPASVKQLALHIESCRDYVLIKDLDSSRSTVQTEATLPPRVNTQCQFKLPLDKRQKSNCKSEGHIQNKEKRQTYYLRKKTGVGQRKSQVHELSEGENNSNGKRESMLNSVSALQTCGESGANLLNRQEKAVVSDTRNFFNVTWGQKSLTGLKNDYEKRLIQSEQSKCARNEGGTPDIHPKQSGIGEISVPKKCSPSVHYQNMGLKPNIDPYRQSLTNEDQEYQSNCTDPMLEKLRHLELDKRNINPYSFSEVVNQNDCSNEVINKSPDNMEDLMKQLEHKNLLCQGGSDYAPLSAMLSDNATNDKAEKIQNNTHSKEFCCMLGWSAQVCGERSKCSCSLVSSTANFEGNELTSYISRQSSKNKFSLIEDDQPSGPPMKGNIFKKPVPNIQQNWKSKEYISGDKSGVGRINSQRRTNSERNSDVQNAIMCDTKANKRDRRKQKQLHNKKSQPPSFEIITNPQEPVCVSNKQNSIFDTGETISEREAKNKCSQLRKLDAAPELSKTNEESSSCFSVLPPFQNLMGEMLPEIASPRDSPDKLKKQTKSKELFITNETTKTPATSPEKAYNLRLDKQNISPPQTSELPSSPKYRPKCCFICDKYKPESVQKTKNYRKLKTPSKENEDRVVKCSQKTLLHTGSSLISLTKTNLKRSYPDLQTKIEISKHDECIVKYSNGEVTPAVQETKCSVEYEKCGQKLGNEDQLDHPGKRQCQGQKRKSTIPGSESVSAKRRKATQSKQNAPPAEKNPTEVALPTCDAVAKTLDTSSGPKGQSSFHEKINLKQCVVKLYRLPIHLDERFPVYNPIETTVNCQVKEEADTEQREK